MASTYLNLYNNATSLRQRGMFGTSSPYNPNGFGWGGTPGNVYVAGGQANKVVHDTLNNKYYGTQKQSDLVKGLEESIKRTQGQLSRKGETSYSTGWMGSLNSTYRNYSAKDRAEQNARIKQQQSYLDNINKGMYKQEANTFFDSYNDHTQGWNNVFTRRYNNTKQEEQNAITRAKNEKIKARNKVIAKANVRTDQIKKTNVQMEKNQQNQQAIGNAYSTTSPSTTANEVNTGLASEKTKNRSKANAILVDNGLNI